MSKLFRIGIKISATAFIWADDSRQALQMAGGMESKLLEVAAASGSDYPTHECDPMAPGLPDITFSPTMTIRGVWDNATVEDDWEFAGRDENVKPDACLSWSNCPSRRSSGSSTVSCGNAWH